MHWIVAFPPIKPPFIEKERKSRSVVSDSLGPHGLYSPLNSPGQNTGVGSPFHSPGNFPNPGIKPRFPTINQKVKYKEQGKSHLMLLTL